MKKTLFVSLAVAVSVFAGQAAVAKSDGLKQLSKQDVLAASQGYILTRAERPQARRSALFAQIKEGMAKRSTLASANTADVDKGWLVFK